MSSSAVTAIAVKLGLPLGAGLLGAAVIAALDPPATRKELFLQALCAGVGSMIFGPVALKIVDHFFDFVVLADGWAYIEWAIPVYFLVGSLSWGACGMLVKLRQLIRDKAAQKIFDRLP